MEKELTLIELVESGQMIRKWIIDMKAEYIYACYIDGTEVHEDIIKEFDNALIRYDELFSEVQGLGRIPKNVKRGPRRVFGERAE